MTEQSHRFKVGSFECIIVKDGNNIYKNPAKRWFSNAPKDSLEAALRRHDLEPSEWKEYVSPYPSLVVYTGSHVVLVDTGLGDVLPTTGKLMTNLEAERVHPEDIDVVILTHGHGDHIGGNLNSEGDPAFPNARYVMWREEWDFWTQEPDLSPLGLDEQRKQLLIDLARKNLLPIRSQVQLVEADTEIVPGVEVAGIPGHTPGLMAVSIGSGNDQLVCISDLALHPIHLEQPEWFADVDLDQKQLLETRRSFFSRLTADGPLVFAFHFPFPGLGHVIEGGQKSWKWKPIEILE